MNRSSRLVRLLTIAFGTTFAAFTPLSAYAQVPASVLAAAQHPVDEAPLETPVFKAGIAILDGYVIMPSSTTQSVGQTNEKPSAISIQTVNFYYNNPVTGIQESHEIKVDPTGRFNASIPMVSASQVLFSTDGYNNYIYLTPGKQSTIYLDLSAKTNGAKWVLFDGANAALNNQVDILGNIRVINRKAYKKHLSDIAGMTYEAYKTYIDKHYETAIAEVDAASPTPNAKRLKNMELQHDRLHYLFMASNELKNAADQQGSPSEQANQQTALAQPDKTYFHFLTTAPINDPFSLYSSLYGNNVNSCKYLMPRRSRINIGNPKPAYLAHIKSTQPLTAQEIEYADYLIAEHFDNWSPKRMKAFRKGLIDYATSLEKTGKLSEEAQAAVAIFKTQLNDKNTKAEALLTALIECINSPAIRNLKLPQETLTSFAPLLEPSRSDPTFQAGVKAFTRTYQPILSALQAKATAQEPLDYLASILGTNQGLVFDLMSTQMTAKALETKTPLSDATLDLLGELSNPFYKTYLTDLNNALKEELVAKRNQGGYYIRTAPEVPVDSLFAALIKPYAGKVILVDFWNTWCGPCRSAMKQLDPAKPEMAAQGVVFLYLADESSPLDTWHNMIPDIHGEHHRLTSTEMEHLRQQFGIKGIPFYLVIDKQGLKTYESLGFPGVEAIKSEVGKAKQ